MMNRFLYLFTLILISCAYNNLHHLSSEEDIQTLNKAIVFGSVKGLKNEDVFRFVFDNENREYSIEIKGTFYRVLEESIEESQKKKKKASFKHKSPMQAEDVVYYFADALSAGTYRLKEILFGEPELQCSYHGQTVYNLLDSNVTFEVKAGEKLYLGEIDVSGMYTEINNLGDYYNLITMKDSNAKSTFKEYFPNLSFAELVVNPMNLIEGVQEGKGTYHKGFGGCTEDIYPMSILNTQMWKPNIYK